MTAIRLCVVGDIHHGADQVTKKGSAALGLLRDVLARAADDSVDAVIDLGDRISDTGNADDIKLADAVGAVFDGSGLPRHHICGNHDRANLTAAENAAALRAETGSRVREIGGWRVVLWQPDVRTSSKQGPRLGVGDLDWLAETLNASNEPTLLFSHVPLSGQAMTGNFWFERNPGHAAYVEQPEIRRVLANAPCSIVAFAGHVHWNSLTVVDAVPHFTLQSLTETCFSFPFPAASFGMLEIDAGKLRWSVAGRDRLAVTLPLPSRGQRRLTPLPRFDEIVGDPIASFR